MWWQQENTRVKSSEMVLKCSTWGNAVLYIARCCFERRGLNTSPPTQITKRIYQPWSHYWNAHTVCSLPCYFVWWHWWWGWAIKLLDWQLVGVVNNNVISHTVSLSRRSDCVYRRVRWLIGAPTPCITPEPARSMDPGWSELRKWRLRVWRLAAERHTGGVGGRRWKLRERVSCSNREMFYAEAGASVTAERMKSFHFHAWCATPQTRQIA